MAFQKRNAGPPLIYGNSRTWTNPAVKAAKDKRALNNARKKLCPRSPFWDEGLDMTLHLKEIAALVEECQKPVTLPPLSEAALQFRQQFDLPDPPPPPPMRKAFEGKTINESPEFISNFSVVVCSRTVFTPYWQKDKYFVAPWPNKQEMKYEGDDRISTDKLHGRFLGAPRMDGNETVNWQHRTMIPPWPLENYYHKPCETDVWERHHHIEELQPTDEEGREALGNELFDLLDPVDRF